MIVKTEEIIDFKIEILILTHP